MSSIVHPGNVVNEQLLTSSLASLGVGAIDAEYDMPTALCRSAFDARASAPMGEHGEPAHLAAAKWLLEYAYTKHPPPGLDRRRAEQEVVALRGVHFRENTLTALKVLQARYAPEKNGVLEHGAERAVIAEEIAKHAFSLSVGLKRGGRDGAPDRTAGLFATREEQEREGIVFSLGGAGGMEEDVEDAD